MKHESQTESNTIHQQQKETVLVWLDLDAYSYINYGIIRQLSLFGNFDFVGIVAAKSDIEFFKNQESLPFKEILYFPECYSQKTSFDLKTLEKFEKKYNLNLWVDILSERYFYKFYTFFHQFEKNEILTIVENILIFFEKLLDKYNPKLILTQPIGENISNLLLYRLAKSKGVNILMPNPGFIHNKIIISDNIFSEEISSEYKKIIEQYDDSSEKYDPNFINKCDFKLALAVQSSFDNGIINISQKLNHYKKRLTNDSEHIYQNYGKTKAKLLKYRFKSKSTINKREQFLEKNSIKSIPNEDFLYFPLQSEPEARILIDAPFFSNQISLVENIARSIPIGYVLFVKEHPMQKMKLWRSVEDYQKIIDLPNVKLIHPNVNPQELISKCKGVISISGATGFEALFYKKPVMLFSNEYYDVVSMVHKINSITDLPNKIKEFISNFQFSNVEFNALMQAYENQSIIVPYFDMIKDGLVVSSIQRNVNDFELTSKNFEKFFNTYKNTFELIAKTIFSKIS